MTRPVLVAVLAISASACSAVQATRDNGTRYTCVPVSAMDRGPFQPTPKTGERLTVKEGDGAKIAQH